MTPDIQELLATIYRSGTALVTLSTIDGEALVYDDTVTHAFLSRVMVATQQSHGRLLGYAILQNHAHLVVTPGPHHILDTLMESIAEGFAHDYQALMGMPTRPKMWNRRYRRWYAADIDELAILLDYVHYDPVQHGLARRPEEWRHSSYAYWIERKLYKLGWGWAPPASILGRRFE